MTGSSTDLVFRRAGVDDLALLTELEARISAGPWNRAQLAGELENRIAEVWLASRSGVPAGYGIIHCCAGEAELLLFGVVPEMRNAGTGRALLEHLIARSRSCGALELHLEVRQSNTPARTLYQRLGFAETGVRNGYYTDLQGVREDAVLYRLDSAAGSGSSLISG